VNILQTGRAIGKLRRQRSPGWRNNYPASEVGIVVTSSLKHDEETAIKAIDIHTLVR
jgi:hypothetical protein